MPKSVDSRKPPKIVELPGLEDARKLLRAFAGEGLWFSRRTLIGQPPIGLGKRVGVQLGASSKKATVRM